MRLEARKYLYDIQQAATLVMQATGDKEFVEYQRDPNPAACRGARLFHHR